MGSLIRGYGKNVALGGAAALVPGVSEDDRADQPLMLLTARSELDLTSGSSTVNMGQVPFDAVIKSVNILYPTAPDVDTSIDIGTNGDNTKYGDHTADSSELSNGDLEQDVSLSNTDQIDAGDRVEVNTDGAAASGTAWVSMVIAPRVP